MKNFYHEQNPATLADLASMKIIPDASQIHTMSRHHSDEYRHQFSWQFVLMQSRTDPLNVRAREIRTYFPNRADGG